MLDFYRKWLAAAGRTPEYTEDDLASASVGEMREMAKHFKIKGRSKLTGDALYEVLLDHVERVPRVPPPVFVELCAGTAAVSLRLQARHARPPVSRMGAKTGYADAILRVMGLRAGLGADNFVWCEPDPGCRLLLHAYTDRASALAAAEVIRGWADEEPRALWERLRAEGPPRLDGGAREVGRWSWLLVRSVAFIGPTAGYMPGDDEDGSGRWVNTPSGVARKWDGMSALPATIHPDARTVDPDTLPAGTVAFIDPPYQGTTGYSTDLPRAEVLALAERWHAAGARVYISEAEPIDLPGWHHVEITDCRKGQKRTFSRQQREWLTCSHPPAWVPQ